MRKGEQEMGRMAERWAEMWADMYIDGGGGDTDGKGKQGRAE